jgi:peptidyl-tRNA hydrolase
VLSKFTEEETKQLPLLVERAAAAVEIWIKDGIVEAMQIANSRQEEKKPEQNVGE